MCVVLALDKLTKKNLSAKFPFKLRKKWEDCHAIVVGGVLQFSCGLSPPKLMMMLGPGVAMLGGGPLEDEANGRSLGHGGSRPWRSWCHSQSAEYSATNPASSRTDSYKIKLHLLCCPFATWPLTSLLLCHV